MIRKIQSKIIKNNSIGLFHDSRNDIKIVANVINEIVNKVNEIVEKINELENK